MRYLMTCSIQKVIKQLYDELKLTVCVFTAQNSEIKLRLQQTRCSAARIFSSSARVISGKGNNSGKRAPGLIERVYTMRK
jgi:hypothetical protein